MTADTWDHSDLWEASTVETILLHNIGGIGRKSGSDANGNRWIEFEVDAFAEQIAGECAICGAAIDNGWMCLDGGEEVCAPHVEFDE